MKDGTNVIILGDKEGEERHWFSMFNDRNTGVYHSSRSI